MNLSVVQGSIQEMTADALIVNFFEGATEPGGATSAVDQALNGAISELIASGDVSGKASEVAVVYTRGAIPARRVLVVGLGKAEELNLETVRSASAAALHRASDLKARQVVTVVHGAGAGGLSVEAAAQATTEGALLALYQYAAPGVSHSKKRQESVEIEDITLVEMDAARLGAVESGMRTAEAVATGVVLTRNLVNMPPNVATPELLAEVAGDIASSYGMQFVAGDREWAAEHNMGAYLAVAQGAGKQPKFIVLEHNSERQDMDTIVLVGKGITFDTGGISIKPSERMGDMKSDMAGAAAVLGAMKVVGELGLPLRVIGITPCTENMPDADAYRPADVITASNGKTIEIISTDAEGRMVLADGLVYAGRYQPKAVIDLATLTGACVVALGQGIAAGIFCNDEALQDKLVASGKAVHERLWPLPLWDDYKKAIKSPVADMKNSGGRSSGVASSAVFLQEFTDYPWAHLDIAGSALAEKDGPYTPAGATGYGVRLLVEFLRNWGG